jgi:hypothetical protein
VTCKLSALSLLYDGIGYAAHDLLLKITTSFGWGQALNFEGHVGNVGNRGQGEVLLSWPCQLMLFND